MCQICRLQASIGYSLRLESKNIKWCWQPAHGSDFKRLRHVSHITSNPWSLNIDSLSLILEYGSIVEPQFDPNGIKWLPHARWIPRNYIEGTSVGSFLTEWPPSQSADYLTLAVICLRRTFAASARRNLCVHLPNPESRHAAPRISCGISQWPVSVTVALLDCHWFNGS